MKVRMRFAVPESYRSGDVRSALHDGRLSTVCEEANCPNLGHCYGRGTATFLVMGDRCTRRCGFCNIETARPHPLDPTEPARLANTAERMGLKHIVITSVDRDDLPDGGSAHFAACIAETGQRNPRASIEALIPDFKANPESLERIFQATPDIINHNIETVPSLYKAICPGSSYENSLRVLRLSSERGILTKTGLILGLGEEISEVENVICEAHSAGVRLLSIGQYLQPSSLHAPLKKYIDREVFEDLKGFALGLGFLYVEAGPLVRSSYHAGDALEAILKNRLDVEKKTDKMSFRVSLKKEASEG